MGAGDKLRAKGREDNGIELSGVLPEISATSGEPSKNQRLVASVVSSAVDSIECRDSRESSYSSYPPSPLKGGGGFKEGLNPLIMPHDVGHDDYGAPDGFTACLHTQLTIPSACTPCRSKSKRVTFPLWWLGVLFLSFVAGSCAYTLFVGVNVEVSSDPELGKLTVVTVEDLIVANSIAPTSGLLLQQWEIPNGEERKLLCVDGLPANYYYSSSPGSRVWYIFLDTDHRESSADWCFNRNSCYLRNYVSDEITITPYTTTEFSVAGVHLLFQYANVIYIPYCSSDAYVGHTDATAENAWLNLQGMRTVKEIIRTAGIQEDSTIFLAGSGAGSRGAMLLLDQLEPSGILPKGCEVRGIFDSGAWTDMKMYKNGRFTKDDPIVAVSTEDPFAEEDEEDEFADVEDENYSFRQQAQQGYRFYRPSLPKACADTYPTQKWKCLMPEYLLPTLQNDFYLINNEFDFAQMNNNFGYTEFPRLPTTKDRLYYALNLRGRIKKLNEKLVSLGKTVFAPACPMHNLFLVDELMFTKAGANQTSKEGGISLKDHLQQWLLKNITQPHIKDDCTGFGCGATCPW